MFIAAISTGGIYALLSCDTLASSVVEEYSSGKKSDMGLIEEDNHFIFSGKTSDDGGIILARAAFSDMENFICDFFITKSKLTYIYS